jgi:hypothetical protein
MKNNKIIAAFMGYEEHENDMGKYYRIIDVVESYPRNVASECLLYDKSWDWLMPVVDKIEAIEVESYTIQFNILKNTAKWEPAHWCGLKTQIKDSKIEASYEAVLDFIKWYNSKQFEKL